MGLIQSIDKLAPNQLLAVELLSSGKSIVDTAEELQVHRNSIYLWLDNKLFTEELNKAIDKKVAMLLVQGMTELEQILLYSPSNKEKLKALEIVLSMSDRYKPKTEITVQAEPQGERVDVDKLLEEIRQTF